MFTLRQLTGTTRSGNPAKTSCWEERGHLTTSLCLSLSSHRKRPERSNLTCTTQVFSWILISPLKMKKERKVRLYRKMSDVVLAHLKAKHVTVWILMLSQEFTIRNKKKMLHLHNVHLQKSYKFAGINSSYYE